LKNLLKKNSAANKDGLYGVSVSGPKYKELRALIPEVVGRGELRIGRFEVTRAQLAESRVLERPERSYVPLNAVNDIRSPLANMAASSVTLEEASSYIKWLSAWTNETWRLPYEDEVRALYENREGENTLDYWAGYAPNLEDTAKLREKAKGLSNTEPLLKEVGSFAGKGKEDEEPIYDLGGNVAEWVLTRDGKGKVIGGSADCPADLKANCTAAPEYVGFRVVRGPAKPANPAQ